MPFYQKGDVRIRYEEAGSGFPLLVTPGGGLNSRVSNWPTAVFNAMEAFKNDFRCITMDQRNANGGESTGPIPVDDPWDAFASDQLGLMDHLGIREFFFMGVKRHAIGTPDRHPKGTPFRHWFRLVPVANGRAPRASRSAFASDGAARVGGACLPTGASRGGTAVQTRCLKRQLSLPVSMISQ